MKSPLEQAKDHILKNCLPLVQPQHRKIIIPCYRQDYPDFEAALSLPEVKRELEKIGIPVELVVIGPDGKPAPEIVIATIDDVASGKVHRYLNNL